MSSQRRDAFFSLARHLAQRILLLLLRAACGLHALDAEFGPEHRVEGAVGFALGDLLADAMLFGLFDEMRVSVTFVAEQAFPW